MMTAARPRWFLSLGNWGDMFAVAGNILAHPEFQPPVHIVHYGMDPHIPSFLRSQAWVRDVFWQPPFNATEYRHIVQTLCERPQAPHDFDLASSTIWPEPQDLVPTHVSLACKRGPAIHRWHHPVLPVASQRWADGLDVDRKDTNILLHPYSLALSGRELHWPHWRPAIAWLLRHTPFRYHLTGIGPHALFDFRSKRLANLSNRTPSQLEVLALARRCDGIITTSNNLSMWSVMTGIPALVCLSAVLKHRENYFRRWIEHAPNVLLERSSSLARFQSQFMKWASRLEHRHRRQRSDEH